MSDALASALATIMQVFDAIVGVMLVVAVLRIFSIEKTLRQIQKAVKDSDDHRREEFDAMSQGGE